MIYCGKEDDTKKSNGGDARSESERRERMSPFFGTYCHCSYPGETCWVDFYETVYVYQTKWRLGWCLAGMVELVIINVEPDEVRTVARLG